MFKIFILTMLFSQLTFAKQKSDLLVLFGSAGTQITNQNMFDSSKGSFNSQSEYDLGVTLISNKVFSESGCEGCFGGLGISISKYNNSELNISNQHRSLVAEFRYYFKDYIYTKADFLVYGLNSYTNSSSRFDYSQNSASLSIGVSKEIFAKCSLSLEGGYSTSIGGSIKTERSTATVSFIFEL